MGKIDIAMPHAPANAVNRRNAVDGRGRRAKRNKRIHVRSTVDKRFKAHAEELEVHEYDGQQQQELGEGEREHVLVAQKELRQRPGEHMAHGQVEQRDGEAEADDQAQLHLLGFGRCIILRARSRHRRSSLTGYGAHERTIPGFFNGCRNRSNRGIASVEFYFHAVFQQVHGYAVNPGNARRCFLNTR